MAKLSKNALKELDLLKKGFKVAKKIESPPTN